MSKTTTIIRKVLPTVLTIIGSGATIAAVIFAAKDGIKFKEALDENPDMTKKEKILKGVKVFGRTIGCTTLSVACGVGAHCMDLNTQANITGLYVAGQQAFKKGQKEFQKYRQKNAEINGEDADISVRKSVEEEKLPEVLRNEDGDRIYTVHLEGFEEGRHGETIQATKADVLTKIIQTNSLLDKVGAMTLNDMREIFGLQKVEDGDEAGWSVDMLCDWWQTCQLDFMVDTLEDGSLQVAPIFCAYGGFLSDYGLDY